MRAQPTHTPCPPPLPASEQRKITFGITLHFGKPHREEKVHKEKKFYITGFEMESLENTAGEYVTKEKPDYNRKWTVK